MAVLDVATFLEPIRPDQPSGPELKYNTDPAVAAAKKLYDECEEARRSDEDSANVGAWKRDVKVADWRKASELAQTLLKSHTKDLQVTAWMIEALTHRQGLDGLHDGLQVFQALLETFWETIHPQPDPDDGSLYYREGVYESLDAERILPLLIRKLPLVHLRNKPSLKYSLFEEQRALEFLKGFEAAKKDENNPRASEFRDFDDDQRKEYMRKEGVTPAEDIREAIDLTDLSFYEEMQAKLQDTIQIVERINQFIRDPAHHGPDSPVFTYTRGALEDLANRITRIVRGKATQEEEGVPEAESTTEEAEAEETYELETTPTETGEIVAPRPRRRPAAARGGPITDADDAVQRILQAVAFLRQADRSDPVAYVVSRALRMGEVYRLGPALDPSSLPPPATEARQEARRLEQEGNWDELLETLETTLAEEAGRGWLDGHRLAHTSLVQLGFETASRAVLALLRSWLSDYPDWPITELNDYTPAANNATRTWVAEQITPPREEAFPAPLPPPSFIEEPGEEEAEGPEPRPPDLWEQAQELRRQGRIAEAFVLLARAARSATNGRDRFLRTLQQARFCLDAQRADFALPLLEDLARQIDTLHLDHWEDGSLLAQVFAGLYRCLKTSDPERARLVYSRLCQLDLSLALACETTDSG